MSLPVAVTMQHGRRRHVLDHCGDLRSLCENAMLAHIEINPEIYFMTSSFVDSVTKSLKQTEVLIYATGDRKERAASLPPVCHQNAPDRPGYSDSKEKVI